MIIRVRFANIEYNVNFYILNGGRKNENEFTVFFRNRVDRR